jgi:glycosyltransferase involved in cell wall biosynthesis
VGAYIAHVISGAPLIVYEMDEWRYSTRRAGISAITLERVFHRRILRAARSVWAISEAMADLMWERYKVKARVLPNLVATETLTAVSNGSRVNLDEFRLVFTGAVYGAQAGAIRNVLNAIRSSFKNVNLCIYTHESAEDLARQGIVGRSVTIKPAVAPEHLSFVFAQADALLLPLSFDEEQRGIVMTSLPTKTADYLISGVPILVHAPAYSSVVGEAKQGQWAAVVEDASVESLNQALERLATDVIWRQQLVLNALQTAKRKHDLRRRRAEFIRAIAGTVYSKSPSLAKLE